MKFGEKSIHASGKMVCSKCNKELYGLGLDDFSMDCYCDANKTVVYTCKECVAIQLKPIEVYGTFNPKRLDDLKPDAIEHIGKNFYWRYLWQVEDGEYEGQYVMHPNSLKHKEYFGWVPECDVDVIEESEVDGE